MMVLYRTWTSDSGAKCPNWNRDFGKDVCEVIARKGLQTLAIIWLKTPESKSVISALYNIVKYHQLYADARYSHLAPDSIHISSVWEREGPPNAAWGCDTFTTAGYLSWTLSIASTQVSECWLRDKLVEFLTARVLWSCCIFRSRTTIAVFNVHRITTGRKKYRTNHMLNTVLSFIWCRLSKVQNVRPPMVISLNPLPAAKLEKTISQHTGIKQQTTRDDRLVKDVPACKNQ